MIENRPWMTVFSHAILVFGVFIVALPVWVALVASTHPASAFGAGQIPMWFGQEGLANWQMLLIERMASPANCLKC